MWTWESFLTVHKQKNCWVVKRGRKGKHIRQMVLSRFVKFVKSVARNQRPALRCIFGVRSITGYSIRTALLEAGTDLGSPGKRVDGIHTKEWLDSSSPVEFATSSRRQMGSNLWWWRMVPCSEDQSQVLRTGSMLWAMINMINTICTRSVRKQFEMGLP